MMFRFHDIKFPEYIDYEWDFREGLFYVTTEEFDRFSEVTGCDTGIMFCEREYQSDKYMLFDGYYIEEQKMSRLKLFQASVFPYRAYGSITCTYNLNSKKG